MTSQYGPTGPNARIRKAFYACTQHQETISNIVLTNPRLKQAYYALLWFTTTTLALATFTTGYTAITTGVTLWTGVTAVLGVLLLYLLPLEANLVSVGVGVAGLAIQVGAGLPALPAASLFAALGLGVLGSVIPGVYLIRHVINIGAQLWDQLLELEEDVSPDASTEDTGETPDADTTSQSN